VRKTVRYILTDYKINKEMAKELNITPVLDKIQKCRSNWVRHINGMPHNSLPRIIRNHSPGTEGIGETIEEICGCVRPERINKCPNSMTAA